MVRGLWTGVVRPVLAYLMASLVVTVVIFVVFGVTDGWSVYPGTLYERVKVWSELFLFGLAVVTTLSAVPTIIVVLIIRALHLPRGRAETRGGALVGFTLPILLVVLRSGELEPAALPVLGLFTLAGALGGRTYALVTRRFGSDRI